MSGRAFAHFMVAHDIGRNLKLARLKPAERWAYVAGVLAIAAQAEMRGALTIGRAPADERDVSRQADVPVTVARATLKQLRTLGVLERDEDGIEWVHDFGVHNPQPRRDETAAERAQRYRDKQRASRDAPRDVTPPSRRDARDDHAAVTHRDDRDGHGGVTSREEVEVEVEVPPYPPEGGTAPSRRDELTAPPRPSGKRQRDLDAWRSEMAEWSRRHFPGSTPEQVKTTASWLQSGPVTVDALRRLAASGESWAIMLGLDWPLEDTESGLTDEQRDTLASVGAQAVELNRRAAS